MKRTCTALAISLLAAVACSSAEAQAPNRLQPVCVPRAQAVDNLTNKHHESQRRWQLDVDGAMLEFWASDKGTWTLFRTRPNGIACIIKAGTGAKLAESL